MSTYLMSDLHGQGARFRAMLEKIHFSPEDRLFILGDVVDRGPDGISLLLEIMETSNITLLLGNHEHMMNRYLSPAATDVDIRRWDKNGNAPTLAAWHSLPEELKVRILDYMAQLPVQLRISVDGKDYFLVHGFPGDTVHDAVWGRPEPDVANPVEGTVLVIGHTPVMYMHCEKEEVPALVEEMLSRGERPRIFHGAGFIDIDCGCSFPEPIKTLGCLRLEDMAEFYV